MFARKDGHPLALNVQSVSLSIYIIILFHLSNGFTNRDYFMVGECVRFLFTSCEGSLNERRVYRESV